MWPAKLAGESRSVSRTPSARGDGGGGDGGGGDDGDDNNGD